MIRMYTKVSKVMTASAGLLVSLSIFGQQLNLSGSDAFDQWTAIATDNESFRNVYEEAVESGNPTEARNTKNMLAWFETFETSEWDRARSYMREDYIQHAAGIQTGRDELIDLLECCWPPGSGNSGSPAVMNMTEGTYRIIADGDYVALQRVRMMAPPGQQPRPMMGLDIIRFDDRGQSAEHWDLFTPGVLETSSGRQIYDNAAEFSQSQVTSDATEAFNKRVVYEFLNTAFGRKQYREAAEQYIGDVYYQHNPNAPDGADAFVDYFESGAMTIVYDVHLMLAQNDLVAVYATQWQQPADAEDWTPMSALDLFRVRNSKIVEHWDFIGPVSPPDSFVHINGDF